MNESHPIRLQADCNGLFREFLCLSHEETCMGPDGKSIVVYEVMSARAFDEDVDGDGKPLIASGTLERPPRWLTCRGSRWGSKD